MLYSKNNFKKLRRLGASRKKYVYTSKTYKNPFFQNKRTPVGRDGGGNKTKLAIFAVITAILILLWLLFFSTLFKIEKIEVNGAGLNMAGEVEQIARDLAQNKLMGKNNLLLFNKTALSKALNDKYYLDDLSIKKKFFHALIITLREKQQAAVWREDEKYYYLDGGGNMITQTDPLNISGSSYPLIENMTGIAINGRQTNISAETIGYITGLFSEFKDKKHNFEIERFIVDKDINTVKMAVISGPKIYFNVKQPIAEQATKLDMVIKDKLKENFMAKEYIDLRYADNVYIK